MVSVDAGRGLGDGPGMTGMKITLDTVNTLDESAFTELVEFVRVGVQLVFAELEPVRGHSSVVDGPLH